VIPLNEEVPPNDVPDRIDCVSEAWLVSEANVVGGVGLGIVALVGRDGDGGNGNGFSDETSCVGKLGM
jgi:hypothetical protein